MTIGKGTTTKYLDQDTVRQLAAQAFDQLDLDGKRVLVIIPDSTRTTPIQLFFRLFYELLAPQVSTLDYLVALGTHQPLDETALNQLLGITARGSVAPRMQTSTSLIIDGMFPIHLQPIGTIPAAEIEHISQGLMVHGCIRHH